MGELMSEDSEVLYKNYLEQCMNIKKDLFELLKSQHQQADQRKEQYIQDAHECLAVLNPLLTDAKNILKDLKSNIKDAKKELSDEFVKLKEQYEFGSICINTITKRMDDLEGYIKNERFHDIVKDICDLENKFEKEAIKIVQNRMRDKK